MDFLHGKNTGIEFPAGNLNQSFHFQPGAVISIPEKLKNRYQESNLQNDLAGPAKGRQYTRVPTLAKVSSS